MSIRFTKKENEGHYQVWVSDKYKIRRGIIYAAGDITEEDVGVYHCYHDGKYLAQRGTLDDAKSILREHYEKNEAQNG